MSKRVFKVTFEVECEVEIDDKVIDRVDDEWRKHLYDLRTTGDIVEHITYNLALNGIRLSQMDGWADMDDKQAVMKDQSNFCWGVELLPTREQLLRTEDTP